MMFHNHGRQRPYIAVITFNVVPVRNETLKYERLGALGLQSRRRYCRHHGYTFIDKVHLPNDRPVCWAKIPAILQAFESHDWVLCADSDALISNPQRRIEEFLDRRHDLIVQSQQEYFELFGVDPTIGLEALPINTGVFIMRASRWSKEFLLRAYEQELFISRGEIWDGIGEQEAMIAVLRSRPQDLGRIGYVEQLQSFPCFHRPDTLFVHFYGNHAEHRIPPEECEEVISRWERVIAGEGPLPADMARFHWCCIQNKSEDSPLNRGGPNRFFYQPNEIDPSPDEIPTSAR